MVRRRAAQEMPIEVAPPMSRRGLLFLLGSIVLAGCVLLFGLGYSIVQAATASSGAGHAVGKERSSTASVRDEIAAEPMLAVAADAGQVAQVAVSLPPATALPAATLTGPAGVPSGYPHTPEGAVAQLAALEAHVLASMSIPTALETYRVWAMPGGIGEADWSQTRNVQSFLTGARQQSNVKDIATLVRVSPVAYQVKGSDGPDWLVACVLLDVHATIRDSARMGYGTCERMQWSTDRWLIAPGAPPATAPSTWPGSDLSVKAGWLPIKQT